MSTLLELILQVNITRGDERMDPRPFGVSHSLPSRLDIFLVTPRETADDGDVTVLVDRVSDGFGNGLDRLEVVFGRGGEPGLDDVDAELRELARDVELLLGGERGAGGLLAVAEGGVEDADVVGVGNAVGDVVRAAAAEGVRGERGWWI